MPSALSQELIDSLLRQQAEEFVTDFETGNYLLSSTIASTPEPELLRAGRRLILSPDAAARILGTRLVRGLKESRTRPAPTSPTCSGTSRTRTSSAGSSAPSARCTASR